MDGCAGTGPPRDRQWTGRAPRGFVVVPGRRNGKLPAQFPATLPARARDQDPSTGNCFIKSYIINLSSFPSARARTGKKVREIRGSGNFWRIFRKQCESADLPK